MTVDEKIKQTKVALEKTKSPYAKRDLQKCLKRLYAEKRKAEKSVTS